MKTGRALIENYLSHPEKWAYRHAYGDSTIDTVSSSNSIRERIGKFTFIGLFAAGFVDGINPCAIATMIFLISFLGTQERSRKEVLKIGLAFTGTVFVTYLSLGLGAFKILSMFEHFYWISLGHPRIRGDCSGYRCAPGDLGRHQIPQVPPDTGLEKPTPEKL